MPDYQARYQGIDLRTIDPFIERSNDLQELEHIDKLLLHDIDRVSLRLDLAEKRKKEDGKPINEDWEYRTKLVLRYFNRSRHKITLRRNVLKEIERRQKQKHFEEVFIELVKHRYPANVFKTLVRDASELSDTGGLAHVQADMDWLEAAGFECYALNNQEYDDGTDVYHINLASGLIVLVYGNFQKMETMLKLRVANNPTKRMDYLILDNPTRLDVWSLVYYLGEQLKAEPNENV